jgi:hypothetical protein
MDDSGWKTTKEKKFCKKKKIGVFIYLLANGFPLKSRLCNDRQWRMLSGISAISKIKIYFWNSLKKVLFFSPFLEQSSSSRLTNCPISGNIRWISLSLNVKRRNCVKR